jgi:hypothetical protein
VDRFAVVAPFGDYASDVMVQFLDADDVERLGSLAQCWNEPFELASPVRSFAAFKGQKNFTGGYWAATSRSQVGYESWVERDAAMALDFDPAVVALASQPFRIAWSDGDRDREHTPDYFVRLMDGTGVVVECARTVWSTSPPPRSSRSPRGSARRWAGSSAMSVTWTSPIG